MALQLQALNSAASQSPHPGGLPLLAPRAAGVVAPAVTTVPAMLPVAPRSQADMLNQHVAQLNQQAALATVPAVATPTPAATSNSPSVPASTLPKAVTGAYIVLDPGHGGKDPGASQNGVKEAVLNLDVAKKVEKLLKEKGFTNVKLTREKDEFLELKEIPKIANDFFATATGGAIKRFISIHHNSSPDTTVKGIETYYSEKNKAYTKGQDAGILFSQNMYDALVKGLPKEQQRGNRAKDFAVLQGSQKVQHEADTSPYKPQAPTTLLELGYVSNPDEAKLLADPAEQDKKAKLIVEGLIADLQEQVGQPTAAAATKTPPKPAAKAGKNGTKGGKAKQA
jgi:N-acetylmuramoyl-L-alanine amidase